MKIILLGKNGQLGWELQRALQPLGQILALDYPEIDFSLHGKIRPKISQYQPDIIVNAAAYTAVDRAESEPDKAMAINGVAPGVLAELSEDLGAALIHYSSDYVFDGEKGIAYIESDTPEPVNVYGQSKLHGEHAIQKSGAAFIILRTSWVYSLRRESFISKVLEWAKSRPTLRIVSDQVSNPTWARMLAEITAQLLAKVGNRVEGIPWLRERRGIYHLAGDGYASRYEWAKAILRNTPRASEFMTCEIEPARTIEFPTPATRPLFSALDCSLFTNTFGLKLPPWDEALQLALGELA